MDLDAEYAEYKEYIACFVSTIDPHDQLPLRVSGYCLRDFEIHGEILDWLMNYLGRSCPITLRMYLVQEAIKKTLEKVRAAPIECGFDPTRNIYQPLKLVKVVVGIVNTLILDLQDNANLYEVPLPPSSPHATELTKLKQPPKYCVDAIKNTRRTMEDKHMIIDDFNAFFKTQDTEPTFYYGIFDGHSGSDAASYANSHLNYNIAVHPKYPSDIETAMREAFLVTDVSFLKKAKAENLNSGTTALCAMYRKTEKKLYVGWCGDSQALIARLGNVRQIVKKHSPEDIDERKRIEALGGVVLFWGNSYRVNGALAVSRAIGDMAHKPFVSAEPEIECIQLDGEEDFIVLGCDGLWDSLTEDDVAIMVYKKIHDNPDSYLTIASELCSLAKSQGSRDNISVIVVYLKEPHLIATQSWPATIQQPKDIMENLNMYEEPSVTQPVTMDALGNTNQDIFNNPFGDFNNQFISDVAIGKSTEITDLVMQQQPENAFNNLTDTMNSINNNKFNNGHDGNNFGADDESPMSHEADQSVLVLNDDNNNSNDNLGGPDMGPETDVDAIDEHFGFEAAAGAVGGAKEKLQMEFKETEDVADRADVMNFGDEHPAAMFGTLENKIFEEMSLHNPDLMKANNPFSDNSIPEGVEPLSEFLDNKFEEEEVQKVQQHMDNFADQMDQFQTESYDRAVDFVTESIETFASSANQDVLEEALQHQPEADLGAFEATQQVIGESGGEESEDEWNYSKGDKKLIDGLAAVEETSEVILESPVVETAEEADTFAVEEQEILAAHTEQEFAEHEFVKQAFDAQQAEIRDFHQEKPEIEDFLLEKQEEHAEEKHQVQDEVEKDLHLTIDTEEFDEMSQLNPDAKEFVPVSPTRSNGQMSPQLDSPVLNPVLGHLVSSDAVVSQSPRKGETPMEDISVPSEKDFDIEVDSRPHEIADFASNGESQEHLNLKEAMQQDDKLGQEYKDEAQPFFEEEKEQTGEAYKVLESSFNEYSNGFQNVIDDAMNRSFYEGRDDDAIMTSPERQSDVLNSIQPIPTFEDEQPEADHQIENDVPESDMLHGVQEVIQQAVDFGLASPTAPKMDSSDNFEAEHFVEEIKSAASNEFNNYVDQELSPTLPEVSFNTIQNVQEAVFEEKPFFQPVEDSFVPEQKVEAFEQPQLLESVQEPVVIPAPEEPKADVIAEVTAGVAAIALAGAVTAVAAKKPAASKTEVKKTEVKKAPVAAKKAPVSSTAAKAPISKPSSAPASTKPPPIVKKTLSASATTKPAPKPAVSSTAAKPAVSSAAASRPKPASTLPPVRKPATATVPKTATDLSAKPASATRTTLAAKKPATSVAATKPLVRPTTATTAAKPKLSNGTATERKPLSSAPISRAPAKPTTLASTAAAKPKLNGTSSLSAKSPTKPPSSTRLSVSAVEKSASTPVKEKTLNRSVGSATKASPRPEAKRPVGSVAAKDLKSPAVASKTTSLTAVGVKKPLSTVKKSPGTTTTGAALAAKKSPTKITAVKKTTTTTTTVVQKKVVNGDIVTEETTTTQTTGGDPQLIEDILKDSLAGLNGHVNGNGLAENGAGDTIQMVLDSAAD